MNKAKLCLFGLAIAGGIGGAVAFNITDPTITTTMYYNTIGETYVSFGAVAADQNLAHYAPIAYPFCCDQSDEVCVFYIDNMGVVHQNIKGDYYNP